MTVNIYEEWSCQEELNSFRTDSPAVELINLIDEFDIRERQIESIHTNVEFTIPRYFNANNELLTKLHDQRAQVYVLAQT